MKSRKTDSSDTKRETDRETQTGKENYDNKPAGRGRQGGGRQVIQGVWLVFLWQTDGRTDRHMVGLAT